MAATALALYVLGLVLAFGWRTWAQWRRTGDTGLRLHAGPPGTLRWWAKILFAAALVLGFAGPVAHFAGLSTIPGLTHPAVGVTGFAAALAGISLTLAAQHAMGSSWRIGVDPAERTALVTTGVFALARNPIFTAMITTSTGLTLMVPNAAAVAGLVVLIAAIELQVRAVEEPYLLATHGATYADYAARVGRFLPAIGQLTTAPTGDHGGPEDQSSVRQ